MHPYLLILVYIRSSASTEQNDIISISNIVALSPSTLPTTIVDSSDLPSESSQDQHSTSDSYSLPNTYHMVTCAKAGIFKSKLFHVTSSTPLSEPTSYKQAMQIPEWLQAIKTEYAALMANRMWSLTPLPSSATVVGCKWVFKGKFHADGTFQRYKARLVAKGYQVEGLDYHETFSHVVKPTTVRVVLTKALSSWWPIHQIDIDNAFLHDTLEENVYMQQPPRFTSHDSSFVCKLHKSIYGLKQAPRSWFFKLSDTLQRMGFNASKSDYSLCLLILEHEHTVCSHLL